MHVGLAEEAVGTVKAEGSPMPQVRKSEQESDCSLLATGGINKGEQSGRSPGLSAWGVRLGPSLTEGPRSGAAVSREGGRSEGGWYGGTDPV